MGDAAQGRRVVKKADSHFTEYIGANFMECVSAK